MCLTTVPARPVLTRVWSAGEGSAKHRGADRRQCAGRAVSRCSCAVGGAGLGARPNLAAAHGATSHARHGAGDRSARLCPARPSRAVLAATQMVEQLVEVPWVSPSIVLCAPLPQMENQLVAVPPIVSQRLELVPKWFRCWPRLVPRQRADGVYWWMMGTSHVHCTPSRMDPPPAQGGIQVLGQAEWCALDSRCGRPNDHTARVPATLSDQQ